MFMGVVWQYASFGSPDGLAPNRRQYNVWTNDVLIYWRIYGLFGFDELILSLFSPRLCFKQKITMSYKIKNNHGIHRCHHHNRHWSPTVPVSVWLPEPARDRGSKQKTLNDDCYHTTCRSAAIFGVQTVLSYLVLTLNLWIGLCPMKRSSGVWNFDEVSVTYRRSFGNHTLAGALCSGNILPEPA